MSYRDFRVTVRDMSLWGGLPPDRAADGEVLLTRHQAATLLLTTSEAVARWVRRGKLAEVRDEDDHPRYRRAAVEAFYRKLYGVALR